MFMPTVYVQHEINSIANTCSNGICHHFIYLFSMVKPFPTDHVMDGLATEFLWDQYRERTPAKLYNSLSSEYPRNEYNPKRMYVQNLFLLFTAQAQ